ncbi:MAG: hypothetical protein K6E54_10510 [Bacteroidaceae bacterium]|nr:hypothetical protein [Bacteroidaceae bacterium]
MKLLEHKRVIAAYILLSVFILIIAILTFHVHKTNNVKGDDCYECLHHVPHSGHYSIYKGSYHDCLLCQLHSISFIAPQVVKLNVEFCKKYVSRLLKVMLVALGKNDIKHTRAPPEQENHFGTISFITQTCLTIIS